MRNFIDVPAQYVRVFGGNDSTVSGVSRTGL